MATIRQDLEKLIGNKTFISKPFNKPFASEWGNAQQLDFIVLKVAEALRYHGHDTPSNERAEESESAPCRIKLSRGNLGWELTRGSNHQILSTGVKLVAEMAKIDPLSINLQKVHPSSSPFTQFYNYVSGPKIYVVTPNRDTADALVNAAVAIEKKYTCAKAILNFPCIIPPFYVFMMV